MITETGRLILSYLLAQDNASISSRNLADLCNLSLSTIRNEINWLNEGLVPYGVHVDARQSQGCRLIVDNEKLASQPFEQLKFDLKRKLFNTKSKTYRSDYIVRRLLISSSYITQEKLSEELFFSPSTVTRSIALAQNSLKRYHLEIKLKKNHGLYIAGDEFNKRIQMLIQHKKYMHLDPIKQAQEKKYSDYFLTRSDHYQKIKKILFDVMTRYPELEFSFINTPKLVNYLILSKQRQAYTKNIQFTDAQLDIIHREPAYEYSKEVFDAMKGFFDFTPSEKDICSFARLLIGFRTLSSLKQIPEENRNSVLERGSMILNELIKEEKLDPDLFCPDAYEQFSCNMEMIHKRIIMGTPIDMETFYPFSGVSGLTADFCCALSKVLKKHLNIEIDQSYTKSNLYLFDRIFDYADKSSIHLKILVISFYGLEYARNVAVYLGRKYKRYIDCIDTCEYSDEPTLKQHTYDVILTDLSASHLPLKNAVSIDFSNGALLCSGFEGVLRTVVNRRLHDLIGNHIHTTQLKSKEDVFTYITELHQKDAASKERFIKDLKKRDACYNSARKNNLAFISTYDETLCNSTLNILINNREIDWNGTKVQYFIFYYRNRDSHNDTYTFNRVLKNLLNKTPSELEEMFADKENLIAHLTPEKYS